MILTSTTLYAICYKMELSEDWLNPIGVTRKLFHCLRKEFQSEIDFHLSITIFSPNCKKFRNYVLILSNDRIKVSEDIYIS